MIDLTIFDEELESIAQDSLDEILEDRRSNKEATSVSEVADKESTSNEEYIKLLEEDIKLFKKLIYQKYDTGKYVTKSSKSMSFILTIINTDKVINKIYRFLLNMEYIGYKSYIAKIVTENSKVSISTVYLKINEMISLGMLEEFNSTIRLTSKLLSHTLNIKNFRHKEIPKDIKRHTKLYLNMMKVGYRASISKKIKKESDYKFTNKRAIIINEYTILYKNRNYLDSQFFIEHSKFTEVYVLSRKLAEKNGRTYNLKYLEDAIDYDKY